MLASLIDGMNEGSGERRRRRRRAPRRARSRRAANRNGSNLSTVLGIIELCWGDVGPAALDAAPGARQLGDRLGRHRGAARALRRQLGGDGDHRARGRLGLGRDPHHRRARRRRVRAQRREDLRHLRRARRPGRRLGDARPLQGPGGDQVVHRRARQPRPEARPPRAQARDPRLRHRELPPGGLPRARRRRCSAARRSTSSRASAARCRPSTTPARWSPAMAVGVARACLEETRELLAERGRRGRLRRARALPSTPPRRACWRWRPTTRRRAC